MMLAGKARGERLAPLEEATLIDLKGGAVVVADGQGREYFRGPAADPLRFRVGGALGHHRITHLDPAGRVRSSLTFRVDTATRLDDSAGRFHELLTMLYYTMVSEFGERHSTLWQGRVYSYFICWLRDHTHVLKGMKYFSDELKSAFELYRDSQRDDGMIWDNVHLRDKEPNHWDKIFAAGDFIRPFADYSAEFKRIPVENDVEYLFVECLYFTWKAVADDAWMSCGLDAAVRALEYSVTSPYRWSAKYQLLKRGYTIDTWDFQNSFDATLGHAMCIDPAKTRFGVMYGDNTGYIAACRQLAEMLERVGRNGEAARYRKRAAEMQERLNKLAWNGRFFIHHVREDAQVKIDLGVDESEQVSLSNAYSLNRGISHEQCLAIIRTYLDLQKNLPAGSPGEWYTIFPPFQKGFGGHNGIWQYMNASVTPIVAGELAHGAFQHGYEAYGVDILNRLIDLGHRHGNSFHCSYTGAHTPPPARTFEPLDLAPLANISFDGQGAPGVPGWTGEGENDLHEMVTGRQVLAGIPFEIPDPAANQRKCALGLARRPGYAPQVDIKIGKQCAAIYFLHTVSSPKAGGVSGLITLHYADGSSFTEYVVSGRNVSGWWFPQAPNAGKGKTTAQVAWRGKNNHSLNVGLIAYGLDNPHPDKPLDRITLSAAEDGTFWAVTGLTLSAEPVWFPISPISFGIPNGWGAAAVVYALIEGLAGVVDAGVGFDQVTLAPRWTAAATDEAAVTVKYPACDGYVAYHFRHDHGARTLALRLTGSGDRCTAHVLLPAAARHASAVTVNERPVEFANSLVESSRYVDFVVDLPGPCLIRITYE